MLHVRRALIVVGLAGSIVLGLMLGGLAFAKEKPAKKAKEPAAKAEKADLFVVPEGSTAELMDYLKRLQKERPDFRVDRMAFIQYMVKSAMPTWQAADKILADKDATKQQKTVAARAKAGALNILCQMRNPEAAEAMKSFPEELAKLGLDELARMVKGESLSMELAKVARKAPDAQPLGDVLDQIKAFMAQKSDRVGIQLVYGAVSVSNMVKQTDKAAPLLDSVLEAVKGIVAEKPDRSSIQLAFGAVSALQTLDKSDKAAALCDEFGKLYAKSEAPGAADLAKKLEGTGRRLRLVGQPMKVEGVLLDGKPFDWSAYKGKVVLVQFWATWCGFCVKEIPHIEECYKNYHDRGFEVVAISADRSQAALDKFLEKNPLPWPVLYKEGEPNPTQEYYGVMSWPTLILVGSDGNVVSLNARGPKLTEALEKLLGPAGEKKTEDKAPKSEDKPSAL
jgi:thiol-disulfide isomerase/thioredoxin